MDFSTIKKRNEAKWYLVDGTIVEEGEIGEKFAVLIRPATPGDLRRLSARSRKKVFGGRRKQTVDDGDQLTKEMLHHSVVDWRNLTSTNEDGSKQAMPCDRANREKLDEAWTEFSQMWQAASTGEFAEDEEALGN